MKALNIRESASNADSCAYALYTLQAKSFPDCGMPNLCVCTSAEKVDHLVADVKLIFLQTHVKFILYYQGNSTATKSKL